MEIMLCNLLETVNKEMEGYEENHSLLQMQYESQIRKLKLSEEESRHFQSRCLSLNDKMDDAMQAVVICQNQVFTPEIG